MTRRRPKWVGSIWLWLIDGQYDSARSEWSHTWRGWLETPGVKLLCLVFGHKAIQDHCGKPEHDVCVFCRKAMPHMAERKQA